MKKLAILPLSLLLLAASCSDEKETPRPPVPQDPVTSVESVADIVNVNVPEQDLEYTIEGNLYSFNYANGQVITYSMVQNNSQYGNIAIVRKIKGASEIIIPPVVKIIGATSGQEVEYKVMALSLYQDCAAGVKKITLPKTAVASVGSSNSINEITAKWFRDQIEMMPDLEDFELETGYPNFCSIKGAVYTADFKNLVAVPRAKTGVFTIADATTTVESYSLSYCNRITGITFPASITNIQKNAVEFNDQLVLINMLPAEAPETDVNAFGKMAQTSLLRIPAGSKASYFPVKPDMQAPVMPAEPPIDCTDEEYEAYENAMIEYEELNRAYTEAMSVYTRPAGFRLFNNVEEVSFTQN
ncbi:MAG: leucine-rich repeat domain-containing protein [Muribaculaceae bacterium]|nr:leucine-rich repeat domain-containing protein [Muribaculaceae bacterium]